jgi:hypothetical protein
MPEHSKAKERQRHLFGKEDSADVGRHFGKSISHTAYNHILEWCSALNKWYLLFLGREISFMYELKRKLYYYQE